MSEFVWTQQQQEVINSRDKNLLVSAGAGSGKTAVLTERLKELVLKEGIDCSKMLVLTFTRAAAAEMRQRFQDKLYSALAEPAGTYELSEREILYQIDAITDAQISTIDSFSYLMARRYFEVAQVDPDFRVADYSELQLIQEEALEEVFEELFVETENGSLEENFDFLALVDLYGGRRSNDDLKDRVRELLRFMESLPYPYEWLDQSIKAIKESDSTSFFELPVFNALLNSLLHMAKRAVSSYREVQFILEELPWGPKATSKEKFELEVETVLELDSAKTLPELIKKFKNLEFAGRARIPAKTDAILKDRMRELRGDSREGLLYELKTLKDKLSSIDLTKEYQKSLKMNKHFEDLCKLTKLVEKRINEKKEKSRILSFNDLERALLKILSDEKTQQEIQKEYNYIFLDEFQDTNDLQEEIIQRIESGNNRYMFGDIKQSIVRP